MKAYPKIHTIFKRDERGNLLEGQFSLPEFEYLKDNQWIFTEKIDGTNIRIQWFNDDIGKGVALGGKTDKAQIPSFLITKLMELFPPEKFGDYPTMCLYGEGYGARIQKGGGNYNPCGVDFILFDVWIGEWWLKREDIEGIADKLGIKTVPILCLGTLRDATLMVKEGFNSTFGNFLAEGIVLKPSVELFNRQGHRIVTKIKHKDFVKNDRR